MTSDEAVKKLESLHNILHAQQQNPSVHAINSILREVIRVYIADLSAEDETTDLSADKAHSTGN